MQHDQHDQHGATWEMQQSEFGTAWQALILLMIWPFPCEASVPSWITVQIMESSEIIGKFIGIRCLFVASIYSWKLSLIGRVCEDQVKRSREDHVKITSPSGGWSAASSCAPWLTHHSPRGHVAPMLRCSEAKSWNSSCRDNTIIWASIYIYIYYITI